MRKLRYRSLLFLALLGSGTVCQVSCSQIAAETIGGLTVSITNSYLRSVLSERLGLSGGTSISSLLSLAS